MVNRISKKMAYGFLIFIVIMVIMMMVVYASAVVMMAGTSLFVVMVGHKTVD